jgi:Putative beta-barrel porin 2
MKKMIIGSLSILLPTIAGASIPLGRGEISLGASASATYDSNLSGRRDAGDDYYGTFAPRISYARRAGKIEADANASISIQRYLDHKEFDSENVSADVSLHLSPKSFQNISGSLTASYVESYSADIDVNARIKSAGTTVSAQSGLVTGPRTSFSVNGNYSNFDRVGASDQETLAGGGSFSYKGFLDDTTLSLIYGYTQALSSGQNLLGASLDQTSHSFSVALSRALYREVNGQISYGYRILNRSASETASNQTSQKGSFITASVDGPFLPRRMFPKIKSHAAISYQDAQTPGINDTGNKEISGDIGLNWDARPSTTVSVSATRSQRLSTSDLTVVSSGVNTKINQQFRHNLTGSFGAAYNWESYRGITRKDHILALDSGLNYSFGRSWTSTASYIYTANSSNAVISDFTRHVVAINVGYTF